MGTERDDRDNLRTGRAPTRDGAEIDRRGLTAEETETAAIDLFRLRAMMQPPVTAALVSLLAAKVRAALTGFDLDAPAPSRARRDVRR